MPFLKPAAAVCAVLLLASSGLTRSASGFHWVRLRLSYATPSEVFSRLGLTHITRHGYTRGLAKGTPDPTFPPGLTDVVPYDAGHALIVRGTLAGVAEFRQRVAAVDVPDPRWQLGLTLLHMGSGDDFEPLSTQSRQTTSDHPLTAAFNDSGSAPQYQVTVHVNHDGTLAVTCRVALLLAPPPGAPVGVLVPTRVWAAPVTKDLRPGDTLTFDDPASVRALARQRLGQPAEDQPEDYQLQVQVSAAPDGAASPAAGGPAL